MSSIYTLFLLILCTQIFAEKPFDKLTNKHSEFKHKLSKELPPTNPEHEEKHVHNEEKPIDASSSSMNGTGISLPDEFSNYTVQVSHHVYYNATFYLDPEVGSSHWVDMSKMADIAVKHVMLSNSHRQATTVNLTFGFPFYGSILHNITIATGGFLYMGDYLHNWIAATQYVAPLMANFDTSQSDDSQIIFADNGTAFIVEWQMVALQDRLDEGNFTFQATLLENGDIIFAYKDVPHTIAEISDDRHPVKVGISDAYILERSLFFVKRKTIYEYHRIDFLKRKISNNTALYFTALPTCASYRDCSMCLSSAPGMECHWCEAAQRCSDGIDRARQDWISHNCPNTYAISCPAEGYSSSTDAGHVVPRKGAETQKGEEVTTGESTAGTSPYSVKREGKSMAQSQDQYSRIVHESYEMRGGGMSVGAIVTLVVFAVVLVSAGFWIVYAYKFPQSSSGQFLIKYRPSQWAMKGDGPSAISSTRNF